VAQKITAKRLVASGKVLVRKHEVLTAASKFVRKVEKVGQEPTALVVTSTA